MKIIIRDSKNKYMKQTYNVHEFRPNHRVPLKRDSEDEKFDDLEKRLAILEEKIEKLLDKDSDEDEDEEENKDDDEEVNEDEDEAEDKDGEDFGIDTEKVEDIKTFDSLKNARSFRSVGAITKPAVKDSTDDSLASDSDEIKAWKARLGGK